MAPRLTVDNLTFRYQDMAMRFDLAVAAGEICAVIGPSGAGKSTLLALIGGFEMALSGSIRVDGSEVSQLPPALRPFDTIFQHHNLFAHLDVETNVGLGLRSNGRFSVTDRAVIKEALVQVELAGFERRRPGELSGGERQRVALARSLVRRKPILLLDEPFAALGPALRRDMLDLVSSMRDRHGVSVLMVTHQPEDARYLADRVAFVDAGEVKATGPTAELLASRELPELRLYLGDWARR